MIGSSGLARVGTAVVGIPVVVGLIWWGGWAYAFGIAVVAAAAQIELLAMAGQTPVVRRAPLALLSGIALVLAPMAPMLAPVALVLLLGAWLHALFRDASALVSDGAVLGFSVLYPPLLLAFLVALRQLDHGFVLTLLIFVLVWGADSAAYYAGRLLGRHKLAPALSPGKTWEGVAGGVVGAALVATWFALWGGVKMHPGHWAALAAIASVVGPLGDLFESGLKRSAGVKDSATLLPGHGGFLDRFDAMAFVAPAAYLYLIYVV